MTTPTPSPSCPFCNISKSYPPIPPSTFLPQDDQDPPKQPSPCPSPTESEAHTQAHLVLSTKHVLAFLDVMPLTRGHLLVVTRDHHEKLGDVGIEVSREIGQWLPIISRVTMRTIFGADDGDWNWNVVQNNGVRAAQQVPHVHFHVIPRPPLDSNSEAPKPSFVMFGRGKRDELDDEEGEGVARSLREELAREVRRIGLGDGELEGRKGKL